MPPLLRPGSKIMTPEELVTRWPGAATILATGCFDMLHVGHIRLLQQAKAKYHPKLLVVGLMCDDQLRYWKGSGRPIIKEDVRAEMVDALECVDIVTIYPELTPEALIRTLKPHAWIKGGDYTIDRLPEANAVLEYGGIVDILTYHDGWSTTGQLHKIRKVGGTPVVG